MDPLTPGTVSRSGRWAVVDRSPGPDGGEDLTAVSRICRHQGGDLSKGIIDADGCLVCPWHRSRYDLTSGEMVDGPKGFLGYHGPVPGYSGLIKAFGKVVRLKVRRAHREAGQVVVDP